MLDALTESAPPVLVIWKGRCFGCLAHLEMQLKPEIKPALRSIHEDCRRGLIVWEKARTA